MQVWKLISHHEDPATAFAANVVQGLIAIGWNNVGDLMLRRPVQASEIGRWIREDHPMLTNSQTGGPSLWNFYAEMEEGDYVIASGLGRFRGVFQITGPYEYRDGDSTVFGYAHVRRAQLTDLDARALWEASGSKVSKGHSVQWTAALCQKTESAAEMISRYSDRDAGGSPAGVSNQRTGAAVANGARPSTWHDWVQAAEISYPDWQMAGRGLAERFPREEGSRRVRSETIQDEGSAYWIKISRPLPGVHLIAFKLDKTDIRTKVLLRVWVDDEYPEVYKRFSRGPRFALDRAATPATVAAQPSRGFEADLKRQQVSVTGVWYSVELAALGSPGNQVLENLFGQFCDYAIACHRQMLSPETEVFTAQESEAAEQREWELDEQAIAAIECLHISATEKLALIKARVNQSGYRRRLLDRWDRKCSVTGFPHPDLLIASHILPWSACATARERWGPDNGLLLPPGLDKAFELGLIGFDDRGKLLLSKRGHRLDIQSALSIKPTDCIRDFHQYPGLIAYLRRHREIHAATLSQDI